MGLIISVIGKPREVCVRGGVYFNILQIHRLGLYFGVQHFEFQLLFFSGWVGVYIKLTADSCILG